MATSPASDTNSENDAYDYPGGWLYFAGTVLGIAGIMRFFDAFWAFRYDGALPAAFDGALFGTDLTTYAWAWVVVGAILILASFGVLYRGQVARWFGIFSGGLLAVSAMWWMPFYPVWSLAYVLLGVLVIYALAAHGGRQGTA